MRIDAPGKRVELEDGSSLSYDTLVIATGAQIEPEAVPGFAEGAHHFYAEEAAVALRDALEAFQGGKLVIGVADIPYKCPPAPLEFAFKVDEYLTKRGLREKTEILYLSPINRVFTIESVSEFADIAAEIHIRHGTRQRELATALIRVPNGPVDKW